MSTQLQLNQKRKAYIINNMQTPLNCAINPLEIDEILSIEILKAFIYI